MNRLTGSTNHPAYISASKLHFKNDRSAIGNFREHHVIRKLDQLANDELQKFSHLPKTNHERTRINTKFVGHLYQPWMLSGSQKRPTTIGVRVDDSARCYFAVSAEADESV